MTRSGAGIKILLKSGGLFLKQTNKKTTLEISYTAA